LGDWGRDGTGHQKAVAEQMDVISRQFGAQFIITTGDNFYDKGVASISDLQWKTSFEAIYNKKGHWISWYPTLGNHDYGLSPQAQVEYSSVSTRWNMPARRYTVQKKISGKQNALFVFTDTSPFVSEYYNRGMSDLQYQDTAAQMKWIKKALGSGGHAWKIAVGHHPLYSSGPHGNTIDLIRRFEPLFAQTQTDFYLCGHDHTLEHIAKPNERTQYLVSGGGGAGLYKINPVANSQFAISSGGFLVMTLYVDKANFYFFNQAGELLYRNQVLRSI
jgi:3',5'-cyclic AMP phosphodiesterase CpdA